MLTGGTGDVNPNWFKFGLSQSAADTFTQTTQPIPVQRLSGGLGKKRAMIMEVLKVLFFQTSAQAEVDSIISVYLTTKSYSTAPPDSDGPVIARIRLYNAITTSGMISTQFPIVVDLTDGAGHGMVVASDNFYLSIASSTTAIVNSFSCWVLYRWKNVGLEEYIGVAQSQMN